MIFYKDLKAHLALIRMPSKSYKFFPLFSPVLPYKVWGLLKKEKTKTSAGNMICSGFKPIVRGVARNPVDHPHGGRTKTIVTPVSP
jgi:large subunit ribosomal protein L2